MATLVFDIETSALPIEMFDEAQQEYLFRETEKIDDAIAKHAKREEITRFMSLWPFTSQVVCIAMLNAETQRGQSIYIAEDFEDDAGDAGPVEFVPVRGRDGTAHRVLGRGEALRQRRHFQRPRLRRAVHLSALGAAQRADHQEELARLPLRRGAALRPGGATDVLQRERARRRGAAVQPGFLLQGVWHRIAQERGRDRHGREAR